MAIVQTIKESLKIELREAKVIWIASAMITKSGWDFIQKELPKEAIQHYLIGVDLATEPSVFEAILSNLEINAKVYENSYTFHPKVYVIEKSDESLVAFVGSSNTTNWGLEKNIEMNLKVSSQEDCKNLIRWFKTLYSDGNLVTKEFFRGYKAKYQKASKRAKEIQEGSDEIKKELSKDKGQFFRKDQHEIFRKEYHRINSESVKELRKSVRNSFRILHNLIYTQFKKFGLIDLYCHHQAREIVSRHYFNRFSGNYVNAMWLHYGKSHAQLQTYSAEEDKSFINNIRIQVIIHEDSLGVWLVLGKDWGSKHDRAYFRNQMKKIPIRTKFFNALKLLGNDYWIDIHNAPKISDINTPKELVKLTNQEKPEEYFIIGRDIDWSDKRLSSKNIAKTVLQEFRKLYPLYEIMRHK